MRIAVLASGRGSNMEAILKAIQDGHIDAEVTLVLSDKPDAKCLKTARAAGVAVAELPRESGETRDAYDARLVHVLESEGPDLIVLAGFMRILSPTFCDAFAGQIVNIHPALLPSFKGAHGIRDTITAGAKLAGCTTHWVTAELDGGPTILQAALAVDGDDEESLAARVLELEHLILPRTIDLIQQGRVAATGAVQSGNDSWRPRYVGEALFSAGF